MLKVCDSVMTQLSRIVDLYFNYDSIVIVTEVYYRCEESHLFILRKYCIMEEVINRDT